ncbi:MAG: hypothetical protein WC607_01030 [Candidatus Micrarchaeia archaeon]
MDSARLLLLASACLAFLFGLDWLFYSLAVLLVCVLFLDMTSQPAPAARHAKGASSSRQAPIIIQSGQDSTAYNFVSEIVSGIMANPPAKPQPPAAKPAAPAAPPAAKPK